MTTPLRITLAQCNFLLGDIVGNAAKIIQAMRTARDIQHAHLIIFPELALTGYPPEDLLYRADLHAQIAAILPRIVEEASGIDVVLGYPTQTEIGCYNRASFIHAQKITHSYDKQYLPNYSVFDEMRYFKSGPPTPCIVEISPNSQTQGIKIALLICEDLWYPAPAAQAKAAGADLILALNASPFSKHKAATREKILKARIAENGLPICYVNQVGGQDELVFDGGSMVFDQKGDCVQQAPFFEEHLLTVTVEKELPGKTQIYGETQITPMMGMEERIYKALTLGLHDYSHKNGFTQVILGLSGGIDSALTLAIAVDALGADKVTAIMMPSRYSADISLADAIEQANTLGVPYQVLSIESIFHAFLETLQPLFQDLPTDITEENLQARCRGTLLMAIANKKRGMVLTTSNKSETAVGYSTLYGDMAGGFCALKDVFKTEVYRLAAYRNTISPVIPTRVLTRAPSAELAPDQTDQDSLPPYPILDAILEAYIEHDGGIEEIHKKGFDLGMVQHIVQMVDRNEYKRRQAPPGIRITERAFGKDRRYPMTSGFSVSRLKT
jgi:NAD+ synthase (glutamine-hydrolysing)